MLHGYRPSAHRRRRGDVVRIGLSRRQSDEDSTRRLSHDRHCLPCRSTSRRRAKTSCGSSFGSRSRPAWWSPEFDGRATARVLRNRDEDDRHRESCDLFDETWTRRLWFDADVRRLTSGHSDISRCMYQGHEWSYIGVHQSVARSAARHVMCGCSSNAFYILSAYRRLWFSSLPLCSLRNNSFNTQVLRGIGLSGVYYNYHTTPIPTFFLFWVTLYPSSVMKFASLRWSLLLQL